MMTSLVNRVAIDVMIHVYLLYFAQDCYEVVQKTTLAMMDRLRKVLELDVGSCTSQATLFSILTHRHMYKYTYMYKHTHKCTQIT